MVFINLASKWRVLVRNLITAILYVSVYFFINAKLHFIMI